MTVRASNRVDTSVRSSLSTLALVAAGSASTFGSPAGSAELTVVAPSALTAIVSCTRLNPSARTSIW